jgi:hypothetical protein
MNKGLQHCTTPTAPISIINYPQLGSLCIIHIHLLAQYHWNWTACGLDFYLLEFRAGYCFVEFCWFLVVSRSEKSDSTMCFIHRIVRPLGSSIVDRGLSIESIWKRVQAVWVPPRCRIISQSLSLWLSIWTNTCKCSRTPADQKKKCRGGPSLEQVWGRSETLSEQAAREEAAQRRSGRKKGELKDNGNSEGFDTNMWE